MPSTGFSRDRPAAGSTGAEAAVAIAGAVAFASAFAVPISSASFFSARKVSLPPGAQRFRRSSFLRKSAFA
jgi:hypothetical protein